jgi:hypothetical protein
MTFTVTLYVILPSFRPENVTLGPALWVRSQ